MKQGSGQWGRSCRAGRPGGRFDEPGAWQVLAPVVDPGVRRSTTDELVISTGERLPIDAEGPFRVQVAHQSAWQRWWQANAADFPPGRWTFHGEEIG